MTTHQPQEGKTHRNASLVKRRAYICIRCQGVYADEPVTECDCSQGADIFWLAEIAYKKLDRRAITYAEFTALESTAIRHGSQEHE